jgi:ABC-type bacteriocin/lantibiotic exporter with double-glycine peptidase domain
MTRMLARVSLFFVALLSLAGTTKPDAIWLDVPFVKQEKDGCGAASISMVMQYWSREKDLRISARADPRVIQQALFSKEAKGIFASAMGRYFEEAGFRAFAFKGAWMDLKNHLLQGRPLIVCLRGSGPRDALHYVVVAGLDGQQNFIFVNDPARRKLFRLDRSSFERSWSAAGNWALLALPQQHE